MIKKISKKMTKIKNKTRNQRKMRALNIITLRVNRIKISSHYTMLNTDLRWREMLQIWANGTSYSQMMLKFYKSACREREYATLVVLKISVITSIMTVTASCSRFTRSKNMTFLILNGLSKTLKNHIRSGSSSKPS